MPESKELSRNSSMTPPSSSATSSVKCLAGILRRMLCSRTLPTHPTDLITESTSVTACDNQQQGLENGAENNSVAPSLVAKLMGLDSMPNVIITSSAAAAATSSISRSRSSDHGMKKDEHGRVKSTLSLREMPMPTFFELENEEFFVLSFENGSEKKQKRLKERKCEKGFGDLKQTSEESCVSLEFVELRKNKKRQKKKKKKKKKVNVELECSSEESSPVSVLDFDHFIRDHDSLSSHSLESNSRRKLSPEPEKFECQSRLRNDNNLMILDDLKTKKADGKCVGSRKKDCKYDQICKMVEADILESNWPCSRKILKHEDFEDIYADFESQILDQLFHELLLHQLIRLPM